MLREEKLLRTVNALKGVLSAEAEAQRRAEGETAARERAERVRREKLAEAAGCALLSPKQAAVLERERHLRCLHLILHPPPLL